MSILVLSILGVCVAIVVYLKHIQRERARLAAVTVGRPSLTPQEFAAKYFSGSAVPIATRCRELLAKSYRFDASVVSPDDKLCADLQFAAHDCLDARDFLVALEREFGIKFSETKAKQMRTMRDIVEAILSHKENDTAEPFNAASAG